MNMNTCTLLMLVMLSSLPIEAFAESGASGKFMVGDAEHVVVDGIAWIDGEDLKIAFTDRKFDRVNFAEDGKVDSFDFMRHEGALMSFGVGDDGSAQFVNVQSGSGSSFMTGIGEKLELTRRDESGLAGTFNVDDTTNVTFDLPITRTLERPGEPLPADGGEPGQVLLARIKAIHDGDLDALMANTPPDQAEEMRQAIASGEADKLLAMAKLFTPTDIAITGGRQAGDMAWVDFTGSESGNKVTGTGKLLRANGRWQVESVSTSQAGD